MKRISADDGAWRGQAGKRQLRDFFELKSGDMQKDSIDKRMC
jgi:hypothetical protein